MISRIFSDIWQYGRGFQTADGVVGFRGFLEPLGEDAGSFIARKKPGVVSTDEFRLIAEAVEGFPTGRHTAILCGGEEFDLLTARSVFLEDEITHYECVVRRKNGGDNG